MATTFEEFILEQIDRENNSKVDSLSKLSTSEQSDVDGVVYVQILTKSSLNKSEVMEINFKPSWMDPIIAYLIERKLPENQKEAQKIKYLAVKYCLIEGELYKKSAYLPLLRCLKPFDAK